jgi:prepilin-type N-terminal cleavage/methylation domain-containing protein
MKKKSSGFTLVELLIVLAIIGYLASIVIGNLSGAKDKAYYARSQKEFDSLNQALQIYLIDHLYAYPADVNRGLPSGLENYLPGGDWPDAPWPGTVYDWDNWTDPATGKKIIQISIRFCPVGGALSTCHFPSESWASNFGVNSAVYYCLEGACRSHINQPITYPGKCVNC